MPPEQLALLPDPLTFLSAFLLEEERENLRPSTISQKRYALLRLAPSIGGMHRPHRQAYAGL